jgi:hypothetical protein
MTLATERARAAAYVVLHSALARMQRALAGAPTTEAADPRSVRVPQAFFLQLRLPANRGLCTNPRLAEARAAVLVAMPGASPEAQVAVLRQALEGGWTSSHMVAVLVAARGAAQEACGAIQGASADAGLLGAVTEALISTRGSEDLHPVIARLTEHSTDPAVQLLLARQAELCERSDPGWMGPMAEAAEKLLGLAACDEGRAAALALALRLQDGVSGSDATPRAVRLLRTAADAERLRQGPPAPAIEDWPADVVDGLSLLPDEVVDAIAGAASVGVVVGAAEAALPACATPAARWAAVLRAVLVEGLGLHAVLAAARAAGPGEGEEGWVQVARALHAATSVGQ